MGGQFELIEKCFRNGGSLEVKKGGNYSDTLRNDQMRLVF